MFIRCITSGIWNFISRVFCAILCLGLLTMPVAQAITKEEATRVGGDLTRVGQDMSDIAHRTEAFRSSATEIVDAVAGSADAMLTAILRIDSGDGTGRALASAARLALTSLLVMFAIAWLIRSTTSRWRTRCLALEVRVRGAAGLLALDALQWAVFATGAYLAVRLYFNSDALHDLLVSGILSGLVRWRLFMLFLHAALRPDVPQLRLFPISDQAALRVKACFALATVIGILAISIMPVLLRAGLPVPVGPLIVLSQDAWVALWCSLALWFYLGSNSTPDSARRRWRWLGGIGIPLIWMSWSVAVVTLEFSAYHSLVYSRRKIRDGDGLRNLPGDTAGAR